MQQLLMDKQWKAPGQPKHPSSEVDEWVSSTHLELTPVSLLFRPHSPQLPPLPSVSVSSRRCHSEHQAFQVSASMETVATSGEECLVATRAASLGLLHPACLLASAPRPCMQSVRTLVWPLTVGGFFQLHRHQLSWASEATHQQTKQPWLFHMVVFLVELPSLPPLLTTTVACHLLQSPPRSWCMLELPSWHWLLSICLLAVPCRLLC
mmetsp:Transcript_95905/g.190097  ORF Transcript_95905/g.190097 Transcript_95905/m.190097 type:complete len:208 (-) Transcript_95905:598-1221(-)